MSVLILWLFRCVARDTSVPPKPAFPMVGQAVAHPVLAAQIGHRHSGLVLLQNPDDLLLYSVSPMRIPMKPDSDSETKPDAYGVHPQTETRKSRTPPVLSYAAFSICRQRECFCSYSSGLR